MNKNWGEIDKDYDMEEDIQELFIHQASWPIKGSISVEIQTKILRYRLLLPNFDLLNVWLHGLYGKSIWLGSWLDMFDQVTGPVRTVLCFSSQFRRKTELADNLLWYESCVGVSNEIIWLRRHNQIDRSKSVSITCLTSCQSRKELELSLAINVL